MPAPLDVVIDELDLCLNTFRKLLRSSDRSESHPGRSSADDETLHWVRQQINARISQIEGLKLDLELGLSPHHLGYGSTDELLEVVEDIKLEIAHLERVARSITERIRSR